MRVLVTGGAGFVGSHVTDRLIADGHTVAIVDNLSTGRRELVNATATLHVCDIRSAGLDAVFATVAPDAVVHVAAQAAVPRSIADPIHDASVNVLGTRAPRRRTGSRRSPPSGTWNAGRDSRGRRRSRSGSRTCTGRARTRAARRESWRSSRTGWPAANAAW
jgi:NAD(P)-dependent dehydrogenase (short-subunit alcohol dehydrogenase family)